MISVIYIIDDINIFVVLQQGGNSSNNIITCNAQNCPIGVKEETIIHTKWLGSTSAKL